MYGAPVLNVTEPSLAKAWEESLILLKDRGVSVKTQYDKPDDPPSLDATMIICVEQPLSEPMIHKDFPGGPADLQEYCMEMLDGIKDHCVRDPNDPDDKRWEYTYHQRLTDYKYLELTRDPQALTTYRQTAKENSLNQLENVIEKLVKQPYTRHAQMITWRIPEDLNCYDPPCLQSMWFRILSDTTAPDSPEYLYCNVRIRSNDAYKAAFMNMFAFISMQKYVLDQVNARRAASGNNKPVLMGRYCHMADSYHLYGSYFKEFEQRFLGGLQRRTFEDRVCNYSDWKEMMEEAIPEIHAKVAEQFTATK